MNGTSRANSDFEPDDGGLDPNLAQLFDEADTPPQPEAFVNATLARLARARRARMIRRGATVGVLMLAGALVAPYVASATLYSASWLSERLPDTVLVLGACVCAALIAWRTASRELR